MTEAEWLACNDVKAMYTGATLAKRFSRKVATLTATGCIRATPGAAEHRVVLGVVEAAEAAAATGRWEDVEALRAQAAAERRRHHGLSAGCIWGLIAEGLTALGIREWWAEVPGFLLMALERARVATGSLGATHADILRDVVGSPFRPRGGRHLWRRRRESPRPVYQVKWRTATAIALANQMYEARDFSGMPILADALQDAGCENRDLLDHCRDTRQVHVRGCWVVDLVLGKE